MHLLVPAVSAIVRRNDGLDERRLLADGTGTYVVLAAHPDDEVIGLASFLPAWARRVIVVHVTDGSPLDLADANAAGYATRESYAVARRIEAEAALALAGISPRSILALGFRDQELSFRLVQLISRLVGLFESLKPELIFTHPYEGGHPDHDSVSLGAAAACRQCRIRGAMLEFCSYHAAGDRLISSDFLPYDGVPTASKILTIEERALKQAMIDAHKTQTRVLKQFAVDIERIRPAPVYDYRRAPHAGRLHYEGRIGALTGAAWRLLAEAAEKEASLDPCDSLS